MPEISISNTTCFSSMCVARPEQISREEERLIHWGVVSAVTKPLTPGSKPEMPFGVIDVKTFKGF